jgi:hypothetical protein
VKQRSIERSENIKQELRTSINIIIKNRQKEMSKILERNALMRHIGYDLST